MTLIRKGLTAVGQKSLKSTPKWDDWDRVRWMTGGARIAEIAVIARHRRDREGNAHH
jgi:hypothetical protein